MMRAEARIRHSHPTPVPARTPLRSIRPRKKPSQDRSRRTVETLLEAATRVLERESLSGFTTNRVAEVAGVGIGSLYQYFPGKDALVAALIARAQSALADAVEDAVERTRGQGLAEAIDALARVAVDHQYRRPALAAAIDHEERRLPVEPVLREAQQRVVGAVAGLLDRCRGDLAPDLPDAAAQDCLAIAKALVDAQAAASRAPPPDLHGRVVRAVLGYLTMPRPPAEADGVPRPGAGRRHPRAS